jgi:cyclopropane-fatty-acyl-phospholipid synthase
MNDEKSNSQGFRIGWLIDLMEKGYLPDFLIRWGVKNLCTQRLRSLEQNSLDSYQAYFQDYVENLRSSPVAIATKDANQQHYEVPAEFFHLVLGKNKKYSSCFWEDSCLSLDKAEDRSLQITMDRAELKDGMSILELGCGWGSLSLAMASRFPQSKILALSNSRTQKEYIEQQARDRGINNLTIMTQDVSHLENLPEGWTQVDRVVSVEMFEHFKNYEILLARIANWLKPEGKLFVHIFSHNRFCYPFETEGDDNWMGKYFFTGGQMPSHHLLSYFQKDLTLKKQWAWNGTHYQKTSEAWLLNTDKNRERILEIFKSAYGEKQAEIWLQRWRVFFISVAEFFGYRRGLEWGVSHYLFEK